jgi:hypothetical protein
LDWRPIVIGFGESPVIAAQLPSNDYRITVTGLPQGYSVKSIKSGATDLLAGLLHVGNQPSDIAIVLSFTPGPSWVRVAGRIEGATNRMQLRPPRGSIPNPATEVGLTSAMFSETIRTQIRPDGSFEFSQVLVGAYHLHILPTTPATDNGGNAIQVGSQGLSNVTFVAPPLRAPGA